MLGSENKTTKDFFSGQLPVKIVKTLNDWQSTLLAESLRSFLETCKFGKGKEERGKRKEEAGKSSKCHNTWFRFLSPA